MTFMVKKTALLLSSYEIGHQRHQQVLPQILQDFLKSNGPGILPSSTPSTRPSSKFPPKEQQVINLVVNVQFNLFLHNLNLVHNNKISKLMSPLLLHPYPSPPMHCHQPLDHLSQCTMLHFCNINNPLELWTNPPVSQHIKFFHLALSKEGWVYFHSIFYYRSYIQGDHYLMSPNII